MHITFMKKTLELDKKRDTKQSLTKTTITYSWKRHFTVLNMFSVPQMNPKGQRNSNEVSITFFRKLDKWLLKMHVEE